MNANIAKIVDKIMEVMQNPPQRKRVWKYANWNYNLVSGKQYHGINAFATGLSRLENWYTSPARVTYKQATELWGNVKKGEKATIVIRSSPIVKLENGNPVTNADGENELLRTYKAYFVFNLDQCDNIQSPAIVEPTVQIEPIDFCENVVNQYISSEWITLVEWNDWRCYYVPSQDKISMTPIKLFDSAEAYYRVLFHEMIHSTGAPQRLARKLEGQMNTFGSYEYSVEELVAEFGSAILSEVVWIGADVNNSGAYLGNRVQKIKETKRQQEVYRAIQRATKAVDYITK